MAAKSTVTRSSAPPSSPGSPGKPGKSGMHKEVLGVPAWMWGVGAVVLVVRRSPPSH